MHRAPPALRSRQALGLVALGEPDTSGPIQTCQVAFACRERTEDDNRGFPSVLAARSPVSDGRRHLGCVYRVASQRRDARNAPASAWESPPECPGGSAEVGRRAATPGPATATHPALRQVGNREQLPGGFGGRRRSVRDGRQRWPRDHRAAPALLRSRHAWIRALLPSKTGNAQGRPLQVPRCTPSCWERRRAPCSAMSARRAATVWSSHGRVRGTLVVTPQTSHARGGLSTTAPTILVCSVRHLPTSVVGQQTNAAAQPAGYLPGFSTFSRSPMRTNT